MRDAGKIFLGSMLVYAAMAACSGVRPGPEGGGPIAEGNTGGMSAEQPPAPTQTMDPPAPAPAPETWSPVPTASAQPMEPSAPAPAPAAPQTIDVPCDKVVESDGIMLKLAELAAPGKTMTELSKALVLLPMDFVPGYEFSVGASTYVKDGSIAVLCSSAPIGGAFYDRTFVRVILP